MGTTAIRDTLVIPDLHCPYNHPDALDFLSTVARNLRPKVVVCIGDEIDGHAVSRYARDPDLPSGRSELKKARKVLAEVYKLFPAVKVCESNHTYRAYARAFDAGIPRDYLRGIREVLQAPPAWQWKDRWEVDGVLYLHGEGFGGRTPALTAAERCRQDVVIGHTHQAAGVAWTYGHRDSLFGMSVGCLVNPRSPAFAYARHHAQRPALGCGVIQDGVPRWVPL